MSGYKYDETGQYNFFLLTVLLIILVPFTCSAISELRGTSAASAAPCDGWNAKDPSVRLVRRRGPTLKKKHVFLLLGWLLVGYCIYRATEFKAEGALYDPFEILGVASSATEKEVKRHYRKLTLKFHPDKVKLAANETMEMVESYFVDITKAYKALTDEDTRRNYELYGHPDGKQEFGMGIAIPKSFIEAQNNVYVLGMYAVLFGVALPYSVGRWWFSTREFTKDGILNDTAAKYFLNTKEHASFGDTVQVLAMATEFERVLAKNDRVVKTSAFDKLQNAVKKQLADQGIQMDGELYKRYKTCQRAAILLYAHMFRVPVSEPALLRLQHETVNHAQRLVRALGNIILSHNWLTAYNHTLTLQQSLVQAVHPTLPATMQLPHVDGPRLAVEYTIPQVAQADEADLARLMPDVYPKERQQAKQVAANWPTLKLVSSDFKVIGERHVTPGSIVQLTAKVKVVPPKKQMSGAAAPQKNGQLAAPDSSAEPSRAPTPDVMADEDDMDTMLGRRSDEADGARPSSAAHTPRITNERKPTYAMFVGDQKLDRVFMQPKYFTDFDQSGETVRTLRMTQQAPGNPGLYTFQLFITSDCYIGTDIRKDMKMRVEPASVLEQEKSAADEDDISDPEEDSLAGQMAAMRGQKVKRIEEDEEDDDDDDDLTESGQSDEGGTTSESDSD